MNSVLMIASFSALMVLTFEYWLCFNTQEASLKQCFIALRRMWHSECLYCSWYRFVRMIFSMMISSPQPFFQRKLKFFSAFLSFLCKWNKPLDSNKLSADETFIWNYILNNFRCMQRIHWYKFQLQLSFYVFPTDILSRNSIPAIGVVLSDSEVLEWY